MPETGTSGLMSGVGKRDGGGIRQHPRPTSTLPLLLCDQRFRCTTPAEPSATVGNVFEI
jgi:hypothetical protein